MTADGPGDNVAAKDRHDGYSVKSCGIERYSRHYGAS